MGEEKYDEACAKFSQTLQGGDVQPVPFVDTVGNVVNGPAVELRDRFHQERRAGDPVGVEVSVDGDEFVAEQGSKDPRDCLVHVRQLERLVRQPVVGGKEGLELGGVIDAPVVEQLNEKRGDVLSPGERGAVPLREDIVRKGRAYLPPSSNQGSLLPWAHVS